MHLYCWGVMVIWGGIIKKLVCSCSFRFAVALSAAYSVGWAHNVDYLKLFLMGCLTLTIHFSFDVLILSLAVRHNKTNIFIYLKYFIKLFCNNHYNMNINYP